MKSTKEHDKRDGKKPQRKTNGDDLRRALNWIVSDDIFAHVRLHGNVKWKPVRFGVPGDAASRARLREVAERLGVHHLANLGGCAAR